MIFDTLLLASLVSMMYVEKCFKGILSDFELNELFEFLHSYEDPLLMQCFEGIISIHS